MKFLVQNQPCYGYTGGKPFDAAKPTLLFIHGSACDHSLWHLQARYFAHHGWNVIAVDLPGHGRSEGQPRTSIGEYSQWVAAFLDNANIRSAVLVGHSMGSIISFETARNHPDRVSKLILMGASVPMPVTELLMNAARDDTALANEMLNAWGHGPQARMGTSVIPGVSLTGAYRRLLQRAAPGVLFTDLTACQAYTPDPAQLSLVQTPTLILLGEKDQMTPPKAGMALAKSMPAARTVLLPGAGHSMMYEAPDAALDAMIAFLK
jgi:pimeloyl-ACP methyl ester carboxylesterase